MNTNPFNGACKARNVVIDAFNDDGDELRPEKEVHAMKIPIIYI